MGPGVEGSVRAPLHARSSSTLFIIHCSTFQFVTADGTVETDSLTASTQVFATLQRRTIEEWPFCEQNNTLLGFTALFTHHNYPPHFEEVGENSFGVGFA